MRIETKAKLDYLKGTKSAIADALVEKGQTVASTDSFRSYADKVRAIKSGGGGLEPGVYFKRHEIHCYGSYYQYWMWFKGGLYCFRLPYTGDGNQYEVYKRTDNTWTKIVDKKVMYGLGAPINLNGKLHFVGYNLHATFDGSAVTVLANLPGTYSAEFGGSAFVDGGKLHAFNGDALYQWDESTDTWSKINTISDFAYSSVYTFEENSEIYVIRGDSIYLYSNGTVTKVASGMGWNNKTLPHNGQDYIYDGSYIKKFDPSTAKFKKLGFMFNLNTKIFPCFSDTPTPNPYIIMGTNSGLVCSEMIVVEDEG